jgi:hypothetical protein
MHALQHRRRPGDGAASPQRLQAGCTNPAAEPSITTTAAAARGASEAAHAAARGLARALDHKVLRRAPQAQRRADDVAAREHAHQAALLVHHGQAPDLRARTPMHQPPRCAGAQAAQTAGSAGTAHASRRGSERRLTPSEPVCTGPRPCTGQPARPRVALRHSTCAKPACDWVDGGEGYLEAQQDARGGLQVGAVAHGERLGRHHVRHPAAHAGAAPHGSSHMKEQERKCPVQRSVLVAT